MEIPRLCVLAFITICLTVQAEETADQRLSTASNCFASNFISKLKTKDGNLISSPFSVQTVLTMLQVGAAGDTEDQLNNALQYKSNDLSKEDIKTYFPQKLLSLSNVSGVTLEIANSMWIEKSYTVKPEYQELIKKDFKAKEESVDFKNNAESATDSINKWANDTTHGLIPKLFKEPLDASTALVLANAIYFKGNWTNPFDPAQTTQQIFYENDDKNSKKMAPLMNLEKKFMYKEDSTLNAQVLELKYVNDVVSMIIVLPKEGSLTDMVNKLNCDNLKNLFTFSETVLVKVTLPKFEITSDLDLEGPLKELGITSVFDAADLSGIGDNLQLTKIIQKAVIKVDEKGSEAAAVTGGVVGITSVMEPTKTLLANHPFLFFLKHNPSNMILFAGKLNKIL